MAVDWTDEAVAATALREVYGIESDLSDAALHSRALAAVEEISMRIPYGGTHVRYAAGGRYIRLHPPATSITSVSEAGAPLVLDTDYRLLLGGRVLDRWVNGESNRWRDTTVTYIGPVADERYDRVVADLVRLSLQYTGLDSVRDGDYAEEAMGARGGGKSGYQAERDNLISELVPSSAGVFA